MSVSLSEYRHKTDIKIQSVLYAPTDKVLSLYILQINVIYRRLVAGFFRAK